MTTTVNQTLAGALDEANPNKVADALQKVKLGTVLTPQKRAIVQTTSVDVILDPPALGPASITARITAGDAISGVYRVTDTDGTEVDSATLGVATLSDDGVTLTFAVALTGVVVDYIPRSAEDLTNDFPTTGIG